ncbi:heavy metal-associated isoprenylated plant protein 35 [Euphorbia lathyris]|uniref:heavy metal-associated isoprenylated plant protein 35 n=1 Tax=Euphorbia lathyris TaxID=212925 RepID=UPI0033143A8E
MAAELKTEPKTEPKPEPKEPVPVLVEENPEPPLKYKTLLLKVSVHCEGCKRKVIKILKNIEGVYKVEIDLRQQKVTVIGNVDGETLINKLLKAGKHAEVWPEKAENKEKKKGKSKNKDKDKENKENQSDQESGEEGPEKEKETIKGTQVVIIQDPSKIGEIGIASKISDTTNVAVSSPAGNESEGGGGGDKTTGGGGGSGGKKKKKKKNKGQNGNNNNAEGGEQSNDAPAGTGSVSQVYGPYGQVPLTSEANHSPPRHPIYQYPVHYYAPPPTVYAVNYNTANPSTSYGASVYPPSYEYAYMHSGTMSEPPPLDLESYSSQPSESFEIFSDENPNACSIM